jgi:hypothetical protein
MNQKEETHLESQDILNLSFDEEFNVLAVEMMGFCQDTNKLMPVEVTSAGYV